MTSMTITDAGLKMMLGGIAEIGGDDEVEKAKRLDDLQDAIEAVLFNNLAKEASKINTINQAVKPARVPAIDHSNSDPLWGSW